MISWPCLENPWPKNFSHIEHSIIKFESRKEKKYLFVMELRKYYSTSVHKPSSTWQQDIYHVIPSITTYDLSTLVFDFYGSTSWHTCYKVSQSKGYSCESGMSICRPLVKRTIRANLFQQCRPRYQQGYSCESGTSICRPLVKRTIHVNLFQAMQTPQSKGLFVRVWNKYMQTPHQEDYSWKLVPAMQTPSWPTCYKVVHVQGWCGESDFVRKRSVSCAVVGLLAIKWCTSRGDAESLN
jgi:hypothetical protein